MSAHRKLRAALTVTLFALSGAAGPAAVLALTSLATAAHAATGSGALLAFAGLASAARAASPAILLRGSGAEPDSLDPQKARSVESQNILRDLCEGLTTLNKAAGVAPGVATDWDVSSDGKKYTFHLRPQARWSNGDRVVATDFVAALRRLVDPATASSYAQVIDVIENAADIVAGKKSPDTLGVAAPTESTVVVTLASPAAYLPSLLSHTSTCPVHRPTLAQHPNELAKPGVMVSNGAFVLKEWVQGSHILATRNHNYWNDSATHLDAVKYLLIPDENAELTRYRAGALHTTYVVPRGQFDWIRANLARELHIAPQLDTYYYGFNLNKAPFKDNPGLRRALSMVIDRERLTQQVLRVGELPAYGWIPPGVSNYTSQSFDYRSLPMTARIAEARRLYAQAGYSAANPLRFELRYNAGEVHNKVAVVVASMWKEALGVQAVLTAVEFKSLLQDIDSGNVQMFRSSWLGDYNDAYTFAQYFKSSFGINLPHYRSAQYDALIDKAAIEVNPAKRRELLESGERIMLRDQPMIPIYFYVNKHLVKPEVQGWYDNVMNVVYSKDLSLRGGAP
ncbi:MAG: peptide ABC transporter substrate-binding protein [Proteobacteria bacterium]|nr:peptide ABC transporter substrate-binding protein [Pseudomonadota bacterium]